MRYHLRTLLIATALLAVLVLGQRYIEAKFLEPFIWILEAWEEDGVW